MKGRKDQGHLGDCYGDGTGGDEHASLAVSTAIGATSFLGGHPDAMSLDQGLDTLLTGQSQLQDSPALPGVHI